MSSASPSYQRQMQQDHSNMPSYLLSSLAASANHQQHQQTPPPAIQTQFHRNIHGRNYNDESEMSKQESQLNACAGYSGPEPSPQASMYHSRVLGGVSMNTTQQSPSNARPVSSGLQRFNRSSEYLAAPTHKNLYILNLPLDATTDQLAALFGTFGAVSHCVILAMLDAQARRRGFIDMGAASEAKAAIEGLNGFVWHGYPIEVSYAIVQRSGGPFEQASGANVIKRNVPRNRFNTGPRRIPTEHIQGGFALQRSGSNNSSGPPSPSCYSDGSGVSSTDSPITSDPCTIFISGLDPAAILDDDDLKHALEPYGRILSGFLSRDEHGISRGFGVVSFSTPEEATRASLGLDGKMLNGRRIAAHNLHYQREVSRGHSPSSSISMAHSGVNDYFSKMIQSSRSSISSSPRGSFSHQLPGQHSPSNIYASLPAGGRQSPSQPPGYALQHSPHGMPSSLPSHRRLDQIPMGAIGAAPSGGMHYGRPSPPSSLGYSSLQSQQYQMQNPLQACNDSEQQQHAFFRPAYGGGSRPIDIHQDARLSAYNQVKLGDAFVPKGAAALAERLGISQSPKEISPLGQHPIQAHPSEAGSTGSATSSHGSKNQRRTSVESHGSSSGSQKSIGSERAASIGAAAHSPSTSTGLPGSLALPWSYTPAGALGLDNLSPASTMSMGSTASSISNLNTPESGIGRSEGDGVSGMGASVDRMWGRSAVLISGSKWNPLNGSPAGTKDLLTGGDIVSRKEEISLAGLGAVGQGKLSSSPRASERRSDNALDLSSLGQHL